MIGYVTLGTNDLPRAAAFYDALLAEIGIKRLMELSRGYAWGVAMDKPALGVLTPFDGQPASVGNGVMVAIVVDSREKVERVHRKALELGRGATPASACRDRPGTDGAGNENRNANHARRLRSTAFRRSCPDA
jgi:catechol 2,3-dioxygenase-like lactoylglutathione lyase family enzyme